MPNFTSRSGAAWVLAWAAVLAFRAAAEEAVAPAPAATNVHDRVLHADPRGGRDGNDGTAGNPLPSLAAALGAAAGDLAAGRRVCIRLAPGVYRESVELVAVEPMTGALAIEAVDTGQAVLSGADPAPPHAWRGAGAGVYELEWAPLWPPDPSPPSAGVEDGALAAAVALPEPSLRREMVWIGEGPLRPAADAAALEPGTFASDAARNVLRVRPAEAGAAAPANAEVAVRASLFHAGNLASLSLRGLRFVRSAGSPAGEPAVRFDGVGGLAIADCAFEDHAGRPLGFSRCTSVSLDRVAIARNGGGATLADCADVRAADLLVEGNWWRVDDVVRARGLAAALQVGGGRHIEISGLRCLANRAHGLRLHGAPVGLVLTNATFAANEGAGLALYRCGTMPAIVDCVVTGNTVGVHAKLSSGASFRGGTIAGNREAQVRVDPCPGTPSAAQARFVPGETGLHFADTTLASGGSPGPLLDLPLLDLFLRGWRSTGVRLDHPKPAEAIRVGGIPVSIETWSAWLAEEPAGKPGGAEAAVPDAGDPPDEAVGDGGGIPVEAPRNWVRLAKDLRARQAEAWTANPYAAAAGAAAERFHPVDLAPFVTRACSGEEGFVGAGLPLGPGPLKMHGVPFVMVGDEATPPMAYGVALESPNFPSAVRALPAEVRIPVGRRAARLYALHVLAYAHGGGRAATCRLEYADGTGAEWPVVSPGNRPGFESEAVLAQATAGANVQDWWPSFPAFSNAGARAAPVVDARPYEAGAIEPPPPVAIRRGALAYRAGTVMGMCVYTAEWRLPHPEKEIAALVFEREPDSPQAYMLLGLTLLADAVPPK